MSRKPGRLPKWIRKLCLHCGEDRIILSRYRYKTKGIKPCVNCSKAMGKNRWMKPLLAQKIADLRKTWGKDFREALSKLIILIQLHRIQCEKAKIGFSNEDMFLLHFPRTCPICMQPFKLWGGRAEPRLPTIGKRPNGGYTAKDLRAIICFGCNRKLNNLTIDKLRRFLTYLSRWEV